VGFRRVAIETMEPVLVNEDVARLSAAAACAERGVRVGCFRPPSVPKGTSRLRLTARATLTDAELAHAGAVLAHVLSRVEQR
jgi:8-amino-7-oxononanoate synthase